MMKEVALVIGLVMAATGARLPDTGISDPSQDPSEAGVAFEANDICNFEDCPKYRVTQATYDHQKRIYKKGRWVKTDVTCAPFAFAYPLMTARLLAYLGGVNSKGRTLPVSPPFLTEIDFIGAEGCEGSYTMYAYLPSSLGKAPSPVVGDLELVKLDAMTVYTRRFDGYAVTIDIPLLQRALLVDSIQGTTGQISSTTFYYAMYDSFVLPPVGRTNEVWVSESDLTWPVK